MLKKYEYNTDETNIFYKENCNFLLAILLYCR